LTRAARLATNIGKILRRAYHNFRRFSDGTTAVELALIAPAFLALLVAILETGVVFFTQQVLQTATTQAGRLVMTGQAQAQNLTAAQFQQDVCNYAGALINCSNLYANIQTFSTFSSMSMLNPVQSNNFQSASLHYSLGGADDIVLVQVFYILPVVTAPLRFNLSNLSSNNRLLVATAVFRNEPYQ
jgi:Flp pilus assembly protein TadG